jgi:hypothetical protein
MSQKAKYISKSVKFGGKHLTLYSIDGFTWSSRKDELNAIMERHEQARINLAQLKGEAPAGSNGTSPAAGAASNGQAGANAKAPVKKAPVVHKVRFKPPPEPQIELVSYPQVPALTKIFAPRDEEDAKPKAKSKAAKAVKPVKAAPVEKQPPAKTKKAAKTSPKVTPKARQTSKPAAKKKAKAGKRVAA